jgi:hypothetical protein
MKKLIVFGSILFLVACKKPVPEMCHNFIGEWHGAKNSTKDYQLTIKSNGTGSFSGPDGNTSGNVYFEGYNFKIGKKRKNIEFITDTVPHRVTLTVNPYTYYQRAVFNGIAYSDRPQ